MKKRNLLLTLLFTVLFAGVTIAQGTITGKVVDASYGESLIGTSVILKGTTTGTVTDIDGAFSFKVPAGSHTLVVSYVGYEPKEFEFTVNDGETYKFGKVRLDATTFALEGVNIMADRAKERETPVAVSNVSKAVIEQQLGSQDLPMIMNTTPSVYATPQGGGAGDARINVRGFNQRNVAIMINGVPVNDMENGWVYWSNWDGVADATSSIQMQRGLSAINLATPSVGGTMNIITSPAEMQAGGSGRFEYGSGNFMKATLSAHTGLINNKFAASVSVVRKVGEGVIDKTWTDLWAFYLGMSYNVNKNHRLEIYAIGAPQRHGQNLYKQNVAAYSHDYAKKIGVADSTLMLFKEATTGRLYNENWNVVSEDYTGKQYWDGKTHDRYDKGFLNERENFYNKPIANLNWYAQWSKKISQFTTVYYSGGKGGGTGFYGKIQYNYDQEPTRIPDFNSTIAHNEDPEYTREGILRNSVNTQWTIGAITKFKINVSENFKAQVGLDWRKAEIEHYYQVRDLLTLPSYYWSGDEFATSDNKVLGDKLNYFNTNTVDWLGGYLQGEYTNGNLSAYGTVGYAMIKYSYVNHFKTADTLGNGLPDVNSGELKANTDWIGGYQLKGGLNYNLSETFNAFGNFGYVSKVPIFDNVIDDGDGTVAADPQNEKFISFELGLGYNSMDNKLNIAGNLYYTTWNDRIFTTFVRLTEDENGIAFIKGLDQRHVGFELEASYRPVNLIGFGAIASIANWQYLNDVDATVKNYDGATVVTEEIHIYTKDLKVGDAPQTQFSLWTNLYPVKGMNIQFIMRHNANYYADFNPTSRTDPADTEQVWKIPSYSVFDLHVNYTLPLKGKAGVDIFAHVFNLFDTFYVQDALDNSSYNGFYGYNDRYSHTVNSAEVFLGLPRGFNLGLKISFR
ncbi:MAG: TonB-dependent receptor [Bacteroidetes bacterium]|nr:TonB-dependent receptor [Bacteroidota bacterium]MBL6943703.1 TonB-dependent receptor [Bacteroidales bacterium]